MADQERPEWRACRTRAEGERVPWSVLFSFDVTEEQAELFKAAYQAADKRPYAIGGPIQASQVYWIGEAGPERWCP